MFRPVMLTLVSLLVVVLAGLGERLWQVVVSQDNVFTGELASLLSSDATIKEQGSVGFSEKVKRWCSYKVPHIQAVVSVATEQDVIETINFSNSKHVPFLAFSGGHGSNKWLGEVQNGIQISMRQLNHVTVREDGKSASIGGGAKSKEVIDALAAVGKQTVTGGCECVGIVAPMLGGGHGNLQGRYGLLSDQLISARVVLANGTLVTASETSHPELFWAMQGAGHNFGIVTEIEYKIYDAPENDWVYEMFVFQGKQLEPLYEISKRVMDKQPVELLNLGVFMNMPEIDENPVIMWMLLYDGKMTDLQTYSREVHDLGPSLVQSGEFPYTSTSKILGFAEDDPACQAGVVDTLRFPIDVPQYDIPALRKLYDLFQEMSLVQPKLNQSMVLLEGYSLQGVQTKKPENSAYAFRDDKLLLAPMIIYGPDPLLDDTAVKYGKMMRQILHEGTGREEMHTYVNYAFGDESLENLFGYEQWRLDRLRRLKAQYDPTGRFGYYAPIS